ncbi:MAG TPA: hypothetical protein VMT85_05180 [Thermoanaerobaculia bacterium]|nr:hypothetical protein [Thermoanaerobaculia bacterium]
MILVVSALAEELAPLAKRIAGRRRVPAPHGVAASGLEGRLGGVTLRLVATGAGHARASSGLRRLLEGDGWCCERMILVGVAGGLDPRLAKGDVVRVGRVLRLDAAGEIATAPAERRLGGDAGGLALTVDRIVAAASEKESLWRRLGEPRAAVVDMESFHWVTTLAELAAPPDHTILRAVSDAAEVSLPSFLPHCVGAGGEISRARVAARSLTSPSSVPALLRLRRDVHAAAVRLADAVEGLV